MARHFVKRVVARGDRPFDAEWMTETFDSFWETEGRPAYELTNLMLEPMTPAGRLLLLAQYGSDGVSESGQQTIADRFATGFAHPELLLSSRTSVVEAKRLIREATGSSWLTATARGALGIAKNQVRDRFATLRGG